MNSAAPEPPSDPYDPTSFDSQLVNVLALPLVAGLAVLVRLSPFGFLLEGFHVWIHELGHASVAWMTGRKAIPLPIGWTNVEQERSVFVYAGVVALLSTLAVYGWRERKAMPVFLGAVLACAQVYMTWCLPEDRGHMWMIFAGVGGEFYVAAAMVGLFYYQFPDGFRWGGCRYFFLFIGAASFSETFAFWRDVKRGIEGIPYGSMIGGEDDGGGDMNILRDDYGWTQHQIFNTYYHLGEVCLAGLVVVYAFFALRLDTKFDLILAEIWQPGDGDGSG
jgi:hypothetical protein